jgi:hypothetical protein
MFRQVTITHDASRSFPPPGAGEKDAGEKDAGEKDSCAIDAVAVAKKAVLASRSDFGRGKRDYVRWGYSQPPSSIHLLNNSKEQM